MFKINDDLSINITRGDTAVFTVNALNELGENYLFQKGDVLRIKVTEKKACENVMFQKDFVVTEETEQVELTLTEEDTKIGEVISKPTDYWYEIEHNPSINPQTIIGYDEDGAKIFKLFPEGKDVEPVEPTPEEIPVVDEELDLTSQRPVQNQAIARAFLNIQEELTRIEETKNITSEDLEPLQIGVEENKINIAKNKGSIEDLSRSLDNHTTNTSNPHNVTANQTHIDKTISGINSDNVQGAIDELKGTIGYTSKNLLPYPYYAYVGSGYSQYVNGNVFTYQGVSYTNDNSIITANGTATNTSYCYLKHRTYENYNLKKGKYILSGCPKGGSDSTYYIDIGKTGADGNFELIGKDYGDGLEFELEEDTSNIAVTMVITKGYTANGLVFEPMISYEGGEYKRYVPSVEGVVGNWTPKGTVSAPHRSYYIKHKNSITIFFMTIPTEVLTASNPFTCICDDVCKTFGISSFRESFTVGFCLLMGEGGNSTHIGISAKNNKLNLERMGVDTNATAPCYGQITLVTA